MVRVLTFANRIHTSAHPHARARVPVQLRACVLLNMEDPSRGPANVQKSKSVAQAVPPSCTKAPTAHGLTRGVSAARRRRIRPASAGSGVQYRTTLGRVSPRVESAAAAGVVAAASGVVGPAPSRKYDQYGKISRLLLASAHNCTLASLTTVSISFFL